jgi:hypothetical protein
VESMLPLLRVSSSQPPRLEAVCGYLRYLNSYPLKCKCGYLNPRPIANIDTEMDVSEFVFTIFLYPNPYPYSK